MSSKFCECLKKGVVKCAGAGRIGLVEVTGGEHTQTAH